MVVCVGCGLIFFFLCRRCFFVIGGVADGVLDWFWFFFAVFSLLPLLSFPFLPPVAVAFPFSFLAVHPLPVRDRDRWGWGWVRRVAVARSFRWFCWFAASIRLAFARAKLGKRMNNWGAGGLGRAVTVAAAVAVVVATIPFEVQFFLFPSSDGIAVRSGFLPFFFAHNFYHFHPCVFGLSPLDAS